MDSLLAGWCRARMSDAGLSLLTATRRGGLLGVRARAFEDEDEDFWAFCRVVVIRDWIDWRFSSSWAAREASMGIFISVEGCDGDGSIS